MPPDNPEICIENWRRERGLTQERLAEMLGVTVVTISRWENGHRIPDKRTIISLKALENEFPRQIADSGKTAR